ncbi:hypothetical protein BKI52_35015 [marine bacterium AO1-C]|nr:hypothetical protein BKI52_35015 [marine bacterium AO1-C]
MISPRLDVFAVLIFLGVIQALFMGLLLIGGASRQAIPNRFLASYLIINTATLLEIFLCYSGYIIYTLHYYDASEPFNFAYGPILFLYIYTFLRQKLPKHWWLHFIPLGVYLLYALFFFIQSAGYKYNAFLSAYHPEIPHIAAQELLSEDPLGIKKHINLISIIFNGVYYGLVLKQFRMHTNQQQTSFWKLSSPKLRWLRNVFLLSLLNYIHWVYRTFFVYQDLQDYTSAAMNTAVIYYISFTLFQHPDIFRQPFLALPEKNKANKYSKSSLSDVDKTAILQKLLHLMETEKIYRDNLLSLPQLAKMVNTSSHNISQVLNERLQKNFFGLLAYYRVEEAKQVLADPTQQNLTIEQIAETVGYNSKSAFNNAFKKLAGETPSAYRKRSLQK